MKISDLWRWDGTLGRGPYLLWGLILMGIKFLVDYQIAARYGVHWTPWHYLVFGRTLDELSANPRHAQMYAVLVGAALPFITTGLFMTLRRLRSVEAPAWLILLFFVPVVNLLLFAPLVVLPDRDAAPGRPDASALDLLIPKNEALNILFTLTMVTLFCVGVTSLATTTLEQYGWGLFVGLPFAAGFLSSILYGWHQQRGCGSCVLVSSSSMVIVAGFLIVFAMEGLGCLVMAVPLAFPLCWLGALLGSAVQPSLFKWRDNSALLILLLALPSLLGAEARFPDDAHRRSVTTVIEVKAAPETVWRHVVSFPPLPPTDDWVFRTGIACPVSASIRGQGVGATRFCRFTTGAFVEPITIWDAPRQLRFDVTDQPPPMQEWSPYAQLSPPHMHGFLLSEQGEFRLERLPGGRTRLSGTTWYRQRMWPAAYWSWYTDRLIQRIHRRVLEHVRVLAEDEERTGKRDREPILNL